MNRGTILTSAIMDLSFTEMHLMINCEYIKAIGQHSQLLIVDRGNHYKQLARNNDQTIPANIIVPTTKSALLYRLISLLNMILGASTIGRYNVDKIFFMSYDVIVFAFGFIAYPRKNRIFLFHHRQIDELRSPIKRMCFNIYKNKINHIVLAEYIKKYLVEEIGVNENRIHVVKHPSYDYRVTGETLPPPLDNKTFVGLSYSNDEKLVKEIIDLEDKLGILRGNNCRLILKSKCHLYESEHLVVFKGPLSRDQYDRYYTEAWGIVALIGTDFIYRISGTMIDALSYGKTIIATNVPCIKEYAGKYPSLFRMAESARDIMNIVISSGREFDVQTYEQFKRDNSFESLQRDFGSLFTKTLP